MFEIDVAYAGLERIERGFDRAERLDLRPLAVRVRERMVEGNRRGLLAGTDADGNPTAPLAESTLDDPRRGGDGPARVPRGEGSRLVEDFAAPIDTLGADRIAVTGHWPNTPWVLYHRGPDRRTGRPARDPVGVRPDDLALIDSDVRSFADQIARF